VVEERGRDERMFAARLLAREHGEEDHAAQDEGHAHHGAESGSARLLQHGEQQRRDAAGQEQCPAHVEGIRPRGAALDHLRGHEDEGDHAQGQVDGEDRAPAEG